MWREVGRNEAREEAGRQARAEAAGYQIAALAEQQREAYELARAQADRAHAAAEAAAQREAEERAAQAEDYRALLLSTGAGRWRTVAEVLAASAGLPAAWPAAEYPAAQVAATHQQEEPTASRGQPQGDAGWLLARHHAGQREWDSPPLRRARAASLQAELDRDGGYGHRVVTTAAGPRWADPDPPRELVRYGDLDDEWLTPEAHGRPSS